MPVHPTNGYLVAPLKPNRSGEDTTLKAIVTGGAGFIGSHLCAALLERGFDVLCVDNLVTGTERNIRDIEYHHGFTFARHDVSLPMADVGHVDYIFHLASPASVTDYLSLPLETLRVNSLGTLHMLELARRHRARFLFTSTSEVYGDPQVHPQREDYWGNVNPNGTRSCYDESKRFGESATLQYGRSYQVDARVVRIFNTYGPHSRADDGRVVPNFITQALRGEPLTIYGDGSQTRSYCYVSDLVRGIEAMMLTDGLAGEVVNLGNPDEYTVLEFASVIADLVGGRQEIEYRSLPEDDPTRRRPDISKARALLGWEPTVDLPTGVARTVAWFREILNLPQHV